MFKLIQRFKLALKPDLIPSDLATITMFLGKENTFQERLEALSKLMEWIRLPVKTTSQDGVPEFIYSRDLRFKFLFNYLDKNPETARNLGDMIQHFVVSGGAVGLYCLTGLSENHGFIGEISNRIVLKFLPEAYSEKDLSEVFKVLFSSEEDAIWMESSFKNNYSYIQKFIADQHLSFEPLKKDLIEAKMILCAQLVALGADRNIRKRLETRKLSESTFLKLNALVNTDTSDDELLEMIGCCRIDLEFLRFNLEYSGVSVDLIFRIQKMEAILDRIEMVIYLGKEYGSSAYLILGQFIGRLIRDEIQTRSVREYVRESLQLLTRKIVERAGEKGDHYIATSVPEQKRLLVAASYAGILTSVTALFKFLIGLAVLPIFFEGFFFFINYALSFLIMQKWHLALSSKQPAYMASALSKHFEKFKRDKNLHEVGVEIKKILRSQVITTVGNLALVIPFCILIDWIWITATGSHLMNRVEAFTVITKHNPFTSFTIGYAFLTGVLLWISSVIAGWVENLIVFREITEIIKNNRVMKKLLPESQLKEVVTHLPGTLGGIAGNISIALLLTLPVVISKFTSLPLDIRHVTLSAGTVTFAFSGLEWSLKYWPAMLTMLFSILVIGFLNFSVSFYFAIRLASSARNLDNRTLRRMFKYALSGK